MKQVTINGSVRATGSKADIRAVRNEGRVPCVAYGNGIENIAFSVDAKDLQTLTNTPYSHIVNLVVDGKEILSTLHDVQYDPITDAAIHADFLAISEDKPVAIQVPVVITGNSEGVKAGGKLAVSCRKLRIQGLVKDLPDELKVDITNLKIGKRINAGDLSYDNITIISPKATIICAVKNTRNAVAEESAEE